MSIFGGGSNLPPSCRVSDIPCNRPEDAMWETIIENFWDKKRIKKAINKPSIRSKRVMGHVFRNQWPKMPSPRESHLAGAINEYIDMAIEYGMELGRIEADNNHRDNEGWDKCYHEQMRNPYLRRYFKALRDCRDEAECLVDTSEFQRLFPSIGAQLRHRVEATRAVPREDDQV